MVFFMLLFGRLLVCLRYLEEYLVFNKIIVNVSFYYLVCESVYSFFL